MKTFISILGGGVVGGILAVCGFHYDNPRYWILLIPLIIVWVIINELVWPRIQ